MAVNDLADLLDALEEVKETGDVNFLVFRNEYAKSNKLINTFLDEKSGNLLHSLIKVLGRGKTSTSIKSMGKGILK